MTTGMKELLDDLQKHLGISTSELEESAKAMRLMQSKPSRSKLDYEHNKRNFEVAQKQFFTFQRNLLDQMAKQYKKPTQNDTN